MQRFKKILFDDGATTGNFTNASEFKYMKVLRFNLTLINAWPGSVIEENNSKYKILISVVIIALKIFSFSSGVHHVKRNWNNLSFYELGEILIVLLITFLTVTRLILTLPSSTKYINVGVLFLTKMHLLYFKDVSEYAKETYRKVNSISHIFTLFLLAQMVGGLSLFNIIPIWNNYSSGKFKEKILYNSTYEHSLYLSLPALDIYTHFDAYVVACVFNWFMIYLCSVAFCMLDLQLSLMVFNLWGHLKILLHDLEHFPLPVNKVNTSIDGNDVSVSAEMYSEEESKIISRKLMDCVDYHRLIVDFTNQMSEGFGAMLFMYYMFHQVSGCLLLLECSQMTSKALIRYLPLSIVLFQQLIQMSIVFELVGSTSEKLKDAVYGVPWHYMDTNNRKIVVMFLYNVQKPIHVKALGVINIGVTTMAAILKTSLSYFTFLRSM